MSGGALALALGAAVLHAGWNVLLAGSRDTAAATGGLLVYGVVLLALPAALAWEVSAEAIPFIAASVVFELAYFVLLARAYRDGELSVVYPVARGVAPALVLVVASTAGLGKGVGALGAVGVLSRSWPVSCSFLRRCPGLPGQSPYKAGRPGAISPLGWPSPLASPATPWSTPRGCSAPSRSPTWPSWWLPARCSTRSPPARAPT